MLGQERYAERRATNLRRDAQKEAGDYVQRNDDLGDSRSLQEVHVGPARDQSGRRDQTYFARSSTVLFEVD